MSQAAVAELFDPTFPTEYLNNLTRREKKLLRRQQKSTKAKQSSEAVKLANIYPLTKGQQKTFKAYNEGKNLILHGVAGTGKTFISLLSFSLDQYFSFTCQN